ncbi:arsenate reductase/protein-tyrosine-phosphatase family protein [Blastococcus sp. SYSU DS0539]
MTSAVVGPGPGAPRVSVLVLCTGNVCRSPAAELLLADRLRSTGVTVVSAGTRALVGRPVHESMAALLRAAGVEPHPFAARALVPEQLRAADLVLVMAREHRAAAVEVAPSAVRRTLLLVEAAAVATAAAADGWPGVHAADAAARLAALPGLAPRYRRPSGAAHGEVPDPYRRSEEDYRGALTLIREAVDRLTGAVTSPAADDRTGLPAPASPFEGTAVRGGDDRSPALVDWGAGPMGRQAGERD